MKIGSNLEKIITKMISAKNCTNSESFNGFARGRRIDWRDPMDTPTYRRFFLHVSENDPFYYSPMNLYQKFTRYTPIDDIILFLLQQLQLSCLFFH